MGNDVLADSKNKTSLQLWFKKMQIRSGHVQLELTTLGTAPVSFHSVVSTLKGCLKTGIGSKVKKAVRFQEMGSTNSVTGTLTSGPSSHGPPTKHYNNYRMLRFTVPNSNNYVSGPKPLQPEKEEKTLPEWRRHAAPTRSSTSLSTTLAPNRHRRQPLRARALPRHLLNAPWR